MNISDFIKNPENRQKLMAIVLGAVIFIILFVLYSYYGDKLFVPSIAVLPESVPTVSEVETIKLDTTPLSGNVFKELKKFGNYPLELSQKDFGRSNPFLSQ